MLANLKKNKRIFNSPVQPQRKTLQTSKYRRQGIAMVWTAIMLLLLILIAGLSLDAAKVYLAANQLQNAADAAALAGAMYIHEPNIDARAIARDTALRNKADNNNVQLALNVSNDIAGDIVIGDFNQTTKIFTAVEDGNQNAMKIVAKRITGSIGGPVPLILGPIANVPTANVSRTAIAIVKLVGAGLITLKTEMTNPPGLAINGTSYSLTVQNGNIQVNSCIDIQHPGPIVADAVNIVDDGIDSGIWNYNQPPMDDPLDSIPTPQPGVHYDPTPKSPFHMKKGVKIYDPVTNNSQLQGPGYYPGGISGNGSLTLPSGIYVVDGVGLTGSFTANNVMFCITGTGSLDLGGNGTVTITPMTSGIYKGISIFDRSTNAIEMKDHGTPDLNVSGTIYLPYIDLTIRGNPGAFGNQLIVHTLDVRGNVTINIPYNGAFGVYVSYLVK